MGSVHLLGPQSWCPGVRAPALPREEFCLWLSERGHGGLRALGVQVWAWLGSQSRRLPQVAWGLPVCSKLLCWKSLSSMLVAFHVLG